MPNAVPGFHVHICLYSVNPAPFNDLFTRSDSVYDPNVLALASNKGAPRSLYEIARKVDRPLDARLTPLTVLWLDCEVRRSTASKQQHAKASRSSSSMSPDAARKNRSARDDGAKHESTHHHTTPLSSVPNSPSTDKAVRSPAPSTPIARFVKENSFRIDDEDQSGRHKSDPSTQRSGSLEVSFGIVHLFRDDASLKDAANAQSKTTLEDDSGSILAVLGVPSYLGPADFLQFIEPAASAISQVRMIREETAGRCMVLLKFRDAANAEEFHKLYADEPFDPVEDPDELCRVVYVTKVTVSTASTLPYAYPMLANSDPWPIINTEQYSSSSVQHASALQRLTTLSELPTCPVCLERMDSSVTGLMTVTCQHTFHCSCLSRWSDSRCPVCRYTQSRLTKKGLVLPSFVPEHGRCAVCGTGSDLWVCLICATVGCGRYKAGHAHRHFKETGHLYSLELETQRVWDYAGDGYVHRLIQSKAEFLTTKDEAGPTPKALREDVAAPKPSSKMIEASGSRQGEAATQSGPSESVSMEDKMEALGLEYSHLLSTQLESQRAYFLERQAEQNEEHQLRSASVLEEAQRMQAGLRQQLDALTSRSETLQTNFETSLKRIKALDADLRSERLMSKGLMTRIDGLMNVDKARQDEMEALRAEKADLSDQVRDLMFFVEARAKVENEGGEELRGGGVEVAESKVAAAAATGTKNKKKKKVAKKPPKAALSAASGTIPTSSQTAESPDTGETASPEEEEEGEEEHEGIPQSPSAET